jgi:hypothetical protein
MGSCGAFHTPACRHHHPPAPPSTIFPALIHASVSAQPWPYADASQLLVDGRLGHWAVPDTESPWRVRPGVKPSFGQQAPERLATGQPRLHGMSMCSARRTTLSTAAHANGDTGDRSFDSGGLEQDGSLRSGSVRTSVDDAVPKSASAIATTFNPMSKGGSDVEWSTNFGCGL